MLLPEQTNHVAWVEWCFLQLGARTFEDSRCRPSPKAIRQSNATKPFVNHAGRTVVANRCEIENVRVDTDLGIGAAVDDKRNFVSERFLHVRGVLE